MSAVLISSEFLSYAGILTTFLFTMPISVKIIHIIRAQVSKLLAAMVRFLNAPLHSLLLQMFCQNACVMFRPRRTSAPWGTFYYILS